MSLFMHTKNGTKPIGGGEIKLKQEIKELRAEIDILKDQIENMVTKDKITNLTDVTEPGYAADARQLNGSVDGTLANLISKKQESFLESIPGNDLNNLMDGTCLAIAMTSQETKNTPEAKVGIVLSCCSKGKICIQFWVQYNGYGGNNLWYRHYINTWGAWKEAI